MSLAPLGEIWNSRSQDLTQGIHHASLQKTEQSFREACPFKNEKSKLQTAVCIRITGANEVGTETRHWAIQS